jgi:hypothetical protein
MQSPLIANGGEISGIGGFVEITKIEQETYIRLGKYQHICRIAPNKA